jgi:antirestriction protein
MTSLRGKPQERMCEMSTNTAPYEAAMTATPHAWVGCRGCNRNGSQTWGCWVDGPCVAADLVAAGVAYIEAVSIAEVGNITAARCLVCDSSEFNVFTFEHYRPFLAGEYSPEKAQEMALSIAAFNGAIDKSVVPRAALLAFADNENLNRMDFAEWLEDAQDRYLGQWATTTDFAKDYADEAGLFGGVSEIITSYFDFDRYYFGDLRHEVDYLEGGFVFRNY